MSNEQEQYLNRTPDAAPQHRTEYKYLIPRNDRKGNVIAETREQYREKVKGVAAGIQDVPTKKVLEDVVADLAVEREEGTGSTEVGLLVKDILAAQDELREIALAKGYKEDVSEEKGK